MMLLAWLHVPRSLQTLTRLSSDSRANLDSPVNRTLQQSATVQLRCWRHHFNLGSLYYPVSGTQTCSTREYNPFMWSIWRPVLADIVLPSETATMYVIFAEIARRFRFAIIAVY